MTNENYGDAHLMHSEAEMEETDEISQLNELQSEIEVVNKEIASYCAIIDRNEHKMAGLNQQTKKLTTTSDKCRAEAEKFNKVIQAHDANRNNQTQWYANVTNHSTRLETNQRKLEHLETEIERRKKMIEDVGNRNILVDKLLALRRVQNGN